MLEPERPGVTHGGLQLPAMVWQSGNRPSLASALPSVTLGSDSYYRYPSPAHSCAHIRSNAQDYTYSESELPQALRVLENDFFL